MSYNESLGRNSNYPPMSQSQWDNAPWNEVEVPEREFEIDVEYTLKKTVTITTNNYTPEYDEETGHVDANTCDVDWEKAYDENGYYSIEELLQHLEGYINEDLVRYKGSASKERELKNMLDSCKGWELYNKEFFEETSK